MAQTPKGCFAKGSVHANQYVGTVPSTLLQFVFSTSILAQKKRFPKFRGLATQPWYWGRKNQGWCINHIILNVRATPESLKSRGSWRLQWLNQKWLVDPLPGPTCCYCLITSSITNLGSQQVCIGSRCPQGGGVLCHKLTRLTRRFP